MTKRSVIIFVMGHPASGKTTLSRRISQELMLPLYSKDETLKEIMFDTFQTTSREWSMKIGKAAYKIMEELIQQQLRAGYSMVIESTFKYEFDNPTFVELQKKYNFNAIQVICSAEPKVLAHRFIERIHNGERHPGHGHEDEGLSHEELIKAYEERESIQPFTLNGEVIEYCTDTFTPQHADAVLQRVKDAYAQG